MRVDESRSESIPSFHSTRFNMNHRLLLSLSLFVGFVALTTGTALAQTDRLYPNEGDAEIGKIKSIAREGVVITVGGKDKAFASGDIRRILFQGDPPELTRAREFVMDGQFDQAADELKQIDFSKVSRNDIKADGQFYLALSRGEMALAGQGDLAAASTAVLNFIRQNSDSYHFYSATRLLGDLAKALGNYEKAAQFYGFMLKSRSTDIQVEAVYRGGTVKLAANDLAGAKTEFGKVIGVKATSGEMKRFQTLAQASMAVVTAKEGKSKEAIEMVNKLIKKLNPTDTATAAKIYNALGASQLAAGNDEDALLAYLHTQLMYSMHAESHVEALKQLAELWTKVGKPDRAAQVRGELQQRYPGLSG